MKRKPLVFEIRSTASRKHAGWHEIMVTIRNLEPVAASIKSVKAKRKQAGILSPSNWADPMKPWDEPTGEIPRDLAKPQIALGFTVDALDHVSKAPQSGPVRYLYLYSTEPLTSTDLIFDWAWLDGSPK